MTKEQNINLKIFRAGALFVLITGLLPSFAVFEATQEPWRLFFDAMTWPIDQQPSQFTAAERQLSAILGGVLSGWAMLLYQLANPKIFTEKIRKLMIQSVWVWFVLDSTGSMIAGLPINALNNISFLVILILPLMRLRA